MKKVMGMLLCAASVAQAASIEAWVPQGWSIIQKAQGDLNSDGLADVALIIENTDAKNKVKNEYLGAPELNLNPRHLLIGLQNKQGGYDLALKQTKFIPSPNSEESPCLQDPLEESVPMSIKNGVLTLQLSYWYSCGTWYSSKHTYRFRHNGAQFALVGYDDWSMHRASGEVRAESVNVLTGRKKISIGSIRNDKEKIRWVNFKFKKAWTLEQLTQDEQIE
ncbi:MAG: hypothetical protein ACRCV6_08445 [Formosimonas sp.]